MPAPPTTTSLFFTLGLSLQLTVLCGRIEGSVCSWPPPPSPTDADGDGEIIRPSPEITERLKLFRSTPNAQMLIGNGRSASEDPSLPPPSTSSSPTSSVVSFCPSRCDCNISLSNQLEVVCSGHFENDFPIGTMRKDVEVLKITPGCRSRDDADSVMMPFDSDTLRRLRREERDKCPVTERHQNKLNLGPNFKYFRLLKALVITDSQVPNIGIRTLWGLSGLRLLDLSRNRLTNVIDKNFDGLYSLRELRLDGNEIRSMVSAAFRHVNQLENLSLRDNQIEELAPRIFYKLRSLKTLDLSGNRLEHVDGGVFVDTPNLEMFSCEHCGLFKLHIPDHHQLNKLHTLRLSNNTFTRVQHIHRNFLANIQVLDLSLNRLTRLPGMASAVLRELNVARNNISELSACALCNTSIAHLNLGYNRFAEVSADLVAEDVRSLRTLTLSGNWIDLPKLGRLLQRVPTLEALDLDHTGIVNFPSDLLAGNADLKRLNLSQNLLVDLEPAVFEKLDHLETMDLSSNFLMGLSLQFFVEVERKKKLRMVYLQNNQWKCDRCHIKPLVHFLRNSLMYWGACFKESSPLCLRCAHPDELLHFHIEDLAEGRGPDWEEQLPDCEPAYQTVHFDTFDIDGDGGGRSRGSAVAGGRHVIGRSGGGSRSGGGLGIWNTNSPYVAVGVAAVLVSAFAAAVAVRYRHYGVYETHEDDQLVDDEDLLRNPVVVLDRNQESYINLKYPVLTPGVDFQPQSPLDAVT